MRTRSGHGSWLPTTTLLWSIASLALIALASCSSPSPEFFGEEGQGGGTTGAESSPTTQSLPGVSDESETSVSDQPTSPPSTVDPARVVEVLPGVQQESMRRFLQWKIDVALETGTMPADEAGEFERFRNEVIDERIADLLQSDPNAAVDHYEALRDLVSKTITVSGSAGFAVPTN